MDLQKSMDTYVLLLATFFIMAHSPNITSTLYWRLAKYTNDLLHTIIIELGYDILMTIIYRVSCLTGYSFGPVEHGIAIELMKRRCIPTKAIGV